MRLVIIRSCSQSKLPLRWGLFLYTRRSRQDRDSARSTGIRGSMASSISFLAHAPWAYVAFVGSEAGYVPAPAADFAYAILLGHILTLSFQ